MFFSLFFFFFFFFLFLGVGGAWGGVVNRRSRLFSVGFLKSGG